LESRGRGLRAASRAESTRRVAAHRMMKRGLAPRLCPLPRASAGFIPRAATKAADLAAHLTRWQTRSTLDAGAVWKFAARERIVANYAPPVGASFLYRRFMLRIASALAERSLARRCWSPARASARSHRKTLENMAVIEKAAHVFRFCAPLVGMDKNEIVDQARRLGTFENFDSTRPGLLHPVRARRIPKLARESKRSRAAESRLSISPPNDRRRGPQH